LIVSTLTAQILTITLLLFVSGKSTLLKALRGNVPGMIQKGERIENQQLKLGVFTQDLAQELDKDARAVDLVTDYARTGSDGDITISDEDARRVMGALGLTGEKSLRQIKALSGGEKARVALSMFSLKASNLLMLDEPSNHLVSFVYSYMFQCL
jgi:ATPase subunit of ABC transporter with duplicated ATPase domains